MTDNVIEMPPITRDLIDIGYRPQLVWRWHRMRHMARPRKYDSKKRTDFLRALAAIGPATAGKLAEHLRISAPAAGQAAVRAVRDGQATRELVRIGRADRMVYSLTARGLRDIGGGS